MITEMTKRRYTLKRRAERQNATRERIVKAAVALHERIGPRKTTISAIAKRAGVQRLTVYRHFPDEAQILEACSGHWLQRNPPPDPSGWAEVADPAERTRIALTQLYDYYRRTQGMWSSVNRDIDTFPKLPGPMVAFGAHLQGIVADLLDAWGVPGRSRRFKTLSALLHHAVQFSTWSSLAGEDLSNPEMADAVATWASAKTP